MKQPIGYYRLSTCRSRRWIRDRCEIVERFPRRDLRLSIYSKPKIKVFIASVILPALVGAFFAQAPGAGKVVFTPYQDAKPILGAEAEILPQGLAGKGLDELARDWPAWIARHDQEIRTRLAQGDEDS